MSFTAIGRVTGDSPRQHEMADGLVLQSAVATGRHRVTHLTVAQSAGTGTQPVQLGHGISLWFDRVQQS